MGRIVVQSGSVVPEMVNSIFGIVFSPTRPPNHNDLLNIQGGNSSLNEYYHISSASFAQIQAGSLTSSSFATTASFSINASSSSFIVPGTTLYVVSSSTQPSYIEPFNLPTVPYDPPFKEGRMFYDSDFHNWCITKSEL